MAIPKDFSLAPVQPGSGPPPAPPTVIKRELYHNPAIFQSVDQHAIAEAQINDYANFRELVWNLLFKIEFTDIQKARVIFRWLTSKNLTQIEFKEEELDAPGRLLNDFKNGKGSYARVFEVLARYSGVPAVSISGWAKGATYHLEGVPLTVLPPNHSWNAVYVGGNWQLLDCHWATRFDLSNGAPAGAKLVDAYDDFYFLVEPGQMVYSHLPEDGGWQLLAQAWAVAEFEQRPHVRSHFFSLGLDLLSQQHGVLYANKGLLTLTLGYMRPSSFTYKVTYGDDKLDKLNGVSINRYLLQEMTPDRLTYYFRAPRPGDYHLTIFAREVFDDGIKPANMIFKSVADFKLVSAGAAADLGSFPYCSDSSWGLDSYVAQYPMIPGNETAIVMCPGGKGEVNFAKEPSLRVYARLINDALSFDTLKRCVTIKENSSKDRVTISVQLPGEGEYGLEVFANDPHQDKDLYSHFCQYLCSFLPPRDFVALYGRVSDRPELPGGDDPSPESPSKAASLQQEVCEPEVEEPEYQPHSVAVYSRAVSVQPPQDFVPTPLAENEVKDRPPASYTSTKQFSNIDVFKNVDNHARQVAKEPHDSFRELIWHLIYVREITNELEKLRAVFVYLCSMDLNKISFVNVKKDSPEELLVKLQNGQTTYSRVFEALCSYAGLQCHAVPGVAKGVDYQPGMHFSGDQGQHSWNAVKVNGTWQLIDCNWAARRLVGKESTGVAESVTYQLDEYYFLPSPDQLGYTHHPQDAVWQLVRRPLTLEEFEGLALVKASFFKLGLALVSHREAVIQVEGNELDILIGCPLAKAKLMRFTFKLTHDTLGDVYHGTDLTQYGMQQMVKTSLSQFTLRLPQPGTYRFVLYAKDLSQALRSGPEASVFSGVGEYEIVCDHAEPVTSFPPCAHTSWGPGDSAELYPLTPQHRGAVVKATDGVAELRFRMGDELRFTAKLKAVGFRDEDLSPYCLVRIVHDEAIVLIAAPQTGEYGLEVYANNPRHDGQTLHHVYQYLVVCDRVPGVVDPFPVLSAGYLGPQPAFHGLGLTVSDLQDPFVTIDGGDAHVSFVTCQPVRMSSQLVYVGGGGAPPEDCSEYVLQQSGDNLVTFVLKLARPGMYKLQVYAIPFADPSDSLPGVYNCLIHCRSSVVNLAPFPKQYAPWKEGCYLFEPLDGHLQPNRPIQGAASSYQHVYFRLEVPRATSVAVVVGEDWFPLEEEQRGLWSGEVQMDSYWGKERKASICVSYEEPASSYSSLLEYSM